MDGAVRCDWVQPFLFGLFEGSVFYSFFVGLVPNPTGSIQQIAPPRVIFIFLAVPVQKAKIEWRRTNANFREFSPCELTLGLARQHLERRPTRTTYALILLPYVTVAVLH